MNIKTDIEIAQAAEPKPIYEVARLAEIDEKYIEPYGKTKAKIDLSFLGECKARKGKLILVTAITPTPAGEGKTTTTIGLGDGLRRIGKKAVLALREPSLGPVFGIKGGATGGGHAQVIPMEDINLHFTGDFHTIGAANNLLAAMLDNHIYQGNALGIDPRKITWKRCVDMNDRQLRSVIDGIGGMTGGVPREDGYDITVASEIMAVFCLATSIKNLKERLSKIIVGYTYDDKPVTAGDLKAAGAMTALLKDALRPNLVQTLEGTPAIVHGGPFANIAHGCNSVIATETALRLGDYAVTEAGFGADLGAEKFFDIKCRAAGFEPSAVVIVATVRALKMHGGAEKNELSEENITALEKGMTIGSVLSSAFDFLYDMENEMNDIYARLGDVDEDEMNKLMEEAGTIQDMLTMHDFYMIDAKVEEVARALGLLDLGLDKDVTDLSGGQRTKVLMGKLLLEKPDILLLNEPTNYLDVEHIEWLKRYLNDYENAFILISHDIPFLNSVVNLIYHMDNKKLDRYVGDYDKFMEVYEMKKAQLEAAYNKQQQEIKELKDFVARNKARVATRNMAMSRQKKLDKMDVIELAAEKPKPEFNFKTARTPGRYIFQTNGLVIGYDDPLSSALDLEMERGQKIVLTGANGIGKTTLLKSILGLIKPLSGSVTLGDYLEIGYFEQEMDQSVTTTCIEEIWNEFPAFSQYEVRSALAKCGLTTKHIESQVRVLSGGEQAKVRLCKLINRETNILLLDEPTNHLDVDAKDELKRALKEYKGSILMVCHEPDFYDGLATDVWDCSKWTTRL